MSARLLAKAMAVHAVERMRRMLWELPLRCRSCSPSVTGQLLSLAIVEVVRETSRYCCSDGNMDVWKRCSLDEG